MKKISVIVPVYNVEKYLRKCLDSIIEQQYSNIEVIVVDDGSTDNSREIIKEYVSGNDKIKYYKKENGGLSDARNYGVQKATGDYICFIDSDDYIDKNLFERIKSYIDKDYDVIKYKIVTVSENGSSIEKHDGPVFDGKTGPEAFNILYASDEYLQPAVLYFIRKSFWDDNNFGFPIGKYHEDFATIPLIILKAKSVVSTDLYGYYYVQSSTSIMRGNDEEKVMQRAIDALHHYDRMCDEIKKYNLDKITEDNVKKYYTNCIIIKVGELSKENQKIYIRKIKKRKMYRNIKITSFKQFIKRIILSISVKLYLKLK